MDPLGPAETRVLAVERGIESLNRDLRALRVQMRALSQGIWAAWSDVSSGGSTCTATFTGTLVGCGGAGVSGQTLTVRNAGGATVGSLITGSGGAFSGSLSITGPSELVKLTCSATNYQPFSTTATLACGNNSLGSLAMTPIVTIAPTLNTIVSPSLFCGTPAAQTVNLSGITDGNGGAHLPVTVTATSSNPTLVPAPLVTYTSPNTTGTLQYAPASGVFGSATISVKVTNSGSTFCGGIASTVRTFAVTVAQPFGPPTLNGGLPNLSFAKNSSNTQTVNLSGIGFGPNPGGIATTITVFGASRSPGIVPNPSTTYTSPGASGSLLVGPVLPNSSGVVTITVTVRTNGPTGPACQTNTFSQTFTVTVS